MDINRGTALWLSQAVEPTWSCTIAFLAGDLAAPVSGAIVPAYGA